MSDFSVCIFTDSIRLNRGGMAPSDGGYSLPHEYDSGVLVWLPSGCFETMQKMGAISVLCNFGFDIGLGYMTYCLSRDFDWRHCMSSGFP